MSPASPPFTQWLTTAAVYAAAWTPLSTAVIEAHPNSNAARLFPSHLPPAAANSPSSPRNAASAIDSKRESCPSCRCQPDVTAFLEEQPQLRVCSSTAVMSSSCCRRHRRAGEPLRPRLPPAPVDCEDYRHQNASLEAIASGFKNIRGTDLLAPLLTSSVLAYPTPSVHGKEMC